MDTLTGGNTDSCYYVGGILSAGIFGYFLFKWSTYGTYAKNQAALKKRRLVVISGCDSGLGLSLAYWAAESGYKVLAGCLDDKSPGAEYLRKKFNANSFFVARLDVTDKNSINKFKNECQSILKTSNSEENGGPTELWAIVSNAAVAVFGESFWQTEDQQERQMNVNFWGTVKLTNSFKSLLLQYKARIIMVTSDCASYALPFLSIYSASKAAQQSWATALRLELGKYGVTVVAYQPGAFQATSKLFAAQHGHYLEMKNQMSETDKAFYGKFFESIVNKVKDLYNPTTDIIKPMDTPAGKRHFFNVLERGNWGPVYIYEDIIHWIFHALIRYLPQKLSDILIPKLMLLSAQPWDKTDYHMEE